MLYLILSTILTLTTFQDLETISGEWISPTANIQRQTIVNFDEHGDMFQGEHGSYVDHRLAFVYVNGEEKWRVVAVYNDRVVLFQENQEPIITFHDFEVKNVYFSETGTYLALLDNEAIDGDHNAIRINSETGEINHIDTHPEGLVGGIQIRFWDDGQLILSKMLQAEWFYKNFFLDSELNLIRTQEVYMPILCRKSSNFFLLSFGEGLHCYNSDAEEVWVCKYSNDTNLITMARGVPAVSEKHDCFILLNDDKIEVRSLATSDIIYTQEIPTGSRTRQVLIDDMTGSFSCFFFQEADQQSSHSYSEHFRLDGSLFDSSFSISSSGLYRSYHVLQRENNHILIKNGQEFQLTDLSNNLIYTYPYSPNSYRRSIPILSNDGRIILRLLPEDSSIQRIEFIDL